jgi:hypothetical protein
MQGYFVVSTKVGLKAEKVDANSWVCDLLVLKWPPVFLELAEFDVLKLLF